MKISQAVIELRTVFKYLKGNQAHGRAHDILRALSLDVTNIYSAFGLFMTDYWQDASKVSTTSDFSIPIFRDQHFHLEMGIFGPLVTREEGYSYAMMHDHGDSILSTINAFGSGYTTLIFNQNRTNSNSNIYPLIYKRHELGNIEFINNYTPHVVFYPPDLTITYALWSSPSERTMYGRLRNLIASNVREREIERKFGIANPTYVLQKHFYPENGRIQYQPYEIRGDIGVNFVQNFLYKLQQISFPDKQLVIDSLDTKCLSTLENEYIAKYLSDSQVSMNHDGDDMIKSRRNCHISEYHKCFPNFDFTLE